MNEFTFMFILRPWCFEGMEVLPNGRRVHQEIFVLRWKTKYAQATACRKAKEAMAEYLREQVKAGRIVPTAYTRQYDDAGTCFDYFRNYEFGFPKFIRVEQPEKYK